MRRQTKKNDKKDNKDNDNEDNDNEDNDNKDNDNEDNDNEEDDNEDINNIDNDNEDYNDEYRGPNCDVTAVSQFCDVFVSQVHCHKLSPNLRKQTKEVEFSTKASPLSYSIDCYPPPPNFNVIIIMLLYPSIP